MEGSFTTATLLQPEFLLQLPVGLGGCFCHSAARKDAMVEIGHQFRDLQRKAYGFFCPD